MGHVSALGLGTWGEVGINAFCHTTKEPPSTIFLSNKLIHKLEKRDMLFSAIFETCL